jgi:hypothetical protein
MKKLHMTKANPGNYSKDKKIYTWLKTFNNGLVELSNSAITVITRDNKTFRSNLKKIEEDFITETFQGEYEDGTSFRLILPGGVAKNILKLQGKGDSISFGGLTGDEYAVHFDLVDQNERDIEEFDETQDTEFISSTASKAETLVMTADSLHEFNPQMASEHIRRFMNLVSDNEIEILKFEHIQNIIYGFVLAIRLKILDEQTANKKLNELKLRFVSKDHLRYENGIHVSGPHGGAGRGIEIVPNFKLREGYLVTIYNQDGVHPVWGNNVQMATKQMKAVHRTVNEIQLRGFGTDPLGNSFVDYGLSIHLSENEIDHIKLHLFDRGVVIKYLQ